MNFYKLAATLFVLHINFIVLKAQQKNDFKAEWAAIEQLDQKGLTKDALKKTHAIFEKANKLGNQPQTVKAAMYEMKYRNRVEEDNWEKNIFYLDTLIKKSNTPAKNILQSMQAELFEKYRNEHLYDLFDRTELLTEISHDISTWGNATLQNKITNLYNASLKNEALLQSASINDFTAIIDKEKNSHIFRPTVYDFLAHRALTHFMNEETDGSHPTYQFILNDEHIFAPAREFIRADFSTKDSSSHFYNALLILQQILRFHLNDADKNALIDADLIRLSFVNDHGVFNNKSELYETALLDMENSNKNSIHAAQAMLLRAQEYIKRGEAYNRLSHTQNQFDIKKGKELCELIAEKYPKSDAATVCKSIVAQIQIPSIRLETEKVNIPNEPFRTLVTFKNAATLYFKIVKTNREELLKMQDAPIDRTWSEVANLSPLRTWTVQLPDQKDLQQHAVEIKMDGLPEGTYLIFSSLTPDFKLNKNIISRQITYVSNISYIYNNKKDIYVLHRNTGKPIANAEVQLWERTYDYAQRKYIAEKKQKYLTDRNGFIKENKSDDSRNFSLQVKYGTDELFTDDYYYWYDYNAYGKEAKTKTFLFTDREIYRPGQTVFFKGIVVNTDTTGRKSTPYVNYASRIDLFDANYQKVSSIELRTNQYGSFNGNFKLPEGGLTGQFFLIDSVNQSQKFIDVEEYKRPKFLTEIKKPEGTYRVNEMITVTGNATAYAGNNIVDAKVVYRVVRRVQYPDWWGWFGDDRISPPYGRGSEMEITNGTTTTDANGQFIISFKAIPDESVNKKDQPVFRYEVSADVTDLNGETRSDETIVAVAYQALELSIDAEKNMPADSIPHIRIGSANMNGLFEKTRVNVSMYSLEEPTRIFRNRYWGMPDLFLMQKKDYYLSFPYDLYADEQDKNKWATLKKVLDITDSTSSDAQFPIAATTLLPGWYKMIALTKDKYGEEVRAEKILYISDEKSVAKNEAVTVEIKNQTAEPGQTIHYQIKSGFDKAWLIHSITNTDQSYKTTCAEFGSVSSFQNQIAVTEADRGGIRMNYIFVQHNRVYQGSELFKIPWSNKELHMSYETFRDKLLPGSKETFKVKITGQKGERIAAEMLVNMYDASLDQFKPHSWNSLELWPYNTGSVNWTDDNFKSASSIEKTTVYAPNIPSIEKRYDAMLNNGWNEENHRERMTYYSKANMAQEPLAMMMVDSAISDKTAKKKMAFAAPVPVLMNKEEAEAKPETKEDKKNDHAAGETKVRKNFNETAFFFPDLRTDEEGNISFSFTMPEALTQWKLMTLAHDKELASAYSEKLLVTQKPLMVQPNVPRFVREGDRMELVTKVVNLSDKEITGTAQLELFNAATNSSVDGWFKNVFPFQYFTVEAGQTVAVKFPIEIPFNVNGALTYRIKAMSKDGTFSDGEEAAIPVLTNRMLVTESMPINMRHADKKNLTFQKLLHSDSSLTLTHQSLTIEYTNNPAWYAIQALPYLMEYPYECAEQSFNRFYANVLAGFVANASPKIKAVFEKWKTVDTAALMSNLAKNEELKSALLQETPWVLDAKSENEQKRDIALLFDLVRLAKEKSNTLNKLKEMQSSNGGFTWFKGGPDDRFITQYILTGIGHLRKLHALGKEDDAAINPLIEKALPYLDARFKEEYDNLIKYKVKMTNDNLSAYAIQYLYMRSFFGETKMPAANKTAFDYYYKQCTTFWLGQSKYMQAMIALALHRNKNIKTPMDILSSLKQNAINKEEMGMYWKEFNTGGYNWYQAPIESQSLMIEAFSDIEGNLNTVDDLKTWLLKQKQTQNWKTTKATAEACYALLLNGSNWLAEEKMATITLGSVVENTSAENTEAGTGYFKKRIEGDKVKANMGNITVSVNGTGTNAPAAGGVGGWGSVYWQYFEDLDKITPAATPLALVKKLYIEKMGDRGPVLQELSDGDNLKVGDKVKVRIELKVDRNMEYVHMKDMRAASMEPTNVFSEYKYQGGLGYYESTKDACTNFFFSELPRGSYVFEYPMFVTHAGNFSNGITTIQCMYAPEFTSHSEGVRVNVE